MKNIIVFRKDIKIELNRYGRLCSIAGQLIERHGKDASKTEILEAMYLRELEPIETYCIDNGLFFEWIDDGTTTTGILILQIEGGIKPELLYSFKIYDPDVKKHNLAEVTQEGIRRLKQGKSKTEVQIEVD